jgi:hypothetical protein
MSNDRDDAQDRPQPDQSGTWGQEDPAAPTGLPRADGSDRAGTEAAGAHGATAYGAPAPSWGGPGQGSAPWGPPQPGERTETAPHGQVPHGQPPYEQVPYGQPPYGQAPYGQPPHGQPPYGQAPYGQPPFGQPPYGQQFAAGPYGPPSPYGPYGPPSAPGRPGTVIAAAVLGLLYGALGLLVTLVLVAFGALVDDVVDAIATSDPSLDDSLDPAAVDSVRAGLVVVGVLALAWAVVMVWGSFLALRGRSRVLLLVGTSIAIAVTGALALFGGIAAATEPDSGGAAGIVLFLLLFLGTVGTLVLLVVRPSGTYFAEHRRRRALAPR